MADLKINPKHSFCFFDFEIDGSGGTALPPSSLLFVLLKTLVCCSRPCHL